MLLRFIINHLEVKMKLFFIIIIITGISLLNAVDLEYEYMKNLEISRFSNLSVSGNIDVFFSQSNKTELNILSDNKDDINDIIIEIKDNTLFISDNRNVRKTSFFSFLFNIKTEKSKSANHPVVIEISSPELRLLKSSGAVNFRMLNAFNQENFEIHTSGACNIYILNILSEKIVINSSGASDVNISGETKTLQVRSSGASDIKAKDLFTLEANVNASGACNISVNVEHSLNVSLSGASSLKYIGNPANLRQSTSGASKIVKL